MEKILITDDEEGIVESLKLILEDENYETDYAYNGFEALKKIAENDYDLMLLDIKMPRMDGMEVLESALKIKSELVVVMISGHGNVETAVESTKLGAFDFLQKPFDIEILKLKIRNALEYKRSKDELQRYKEELLESNLLIGNSPSINGIKDKIAKYSNLDFNILITGESGTGKLLIARNIHLYSGREHMPFVSINCASMTLDNFEKELLGFEENGKVFHGKLVEAESGTVFFDEITNLKPELQSIILRVTEENKFTRGSSLQIIPIKARLIFSTNKDIPALIEEGQFKAELYHRINVLNINLAPLRERQEDIPELVDYFSTKISKAYNSPKKVFSRKATELLKSFRFPGNVRELKNLIERLTFSVDADEITDEMIEMPNSMHTKIFSELMNKNMSLNEFQNESEKIFLLKMLNDYKFNISQTADALQIQRSHLYKLMSKYEIPTPSKKGDRQ